MQVPCVYTVMIAMDKLHPHEVGLSETAIRKRRRSRRLAVVMLTIALLTGIAGWPLFGASVSSAIHIKEQPPSLVIIAYALLIVSSATLVLGFWYMLLAQVERLARMVDTAELEAHEQATHCAKCHKDADPDDRFCRHCGEPRTLPPAPRP